MRCCVIFVLLISLQLLQAAVINNGAAWKSKVHKRDLFQELEELLRKYKDNNSASNVDLKKLRELRDMMEGALDLLDDIYDEASRGATTVAPTKAPTQPPTWVYKDCADAYNSGRQTSGVYTIEFPTVNGTTTRSVYCNMEVSGGGWTVFQRRFNGSVDFYLNWHEYVGGFGNANGEYWLGLEALHQLTKNEDQELYILLEEFNTTNSMKYARYRFFKVGSESTRYKLTSSQFTGTAGDGLSYHQNMKFTTEDRDNDERSGVNCAHERGGGWWYKNCMMSNLNGKYRYTAKDVSHRFGFSWYHLKSTYQYFLKGSAMMIRPRKPQ